MSASTESLLRGRKLKSYLHDLLTAPCWEQRLEELNNIPVKKLISPLFSALFSNDPYLKWHAITAFGFIYGNNNYGIIAQGEDLIRRCMWNLNEESGNIPWGMPEVMAEIMAVQTTLFNGFENIFISYISETDGDDNYLDFDKLRTGVYWGACRLAALKPSFARNHAAVFYNAIKTETLPENLIYLCIIFGKGKLYEYRSVIKEMKKLNSSAQVYLDKKLINLKIKEAAEISLAKLEYY